MLTPLGLRVYCSFVNSMIRTNYINTQLGRRPMTSVMLKFYFRAASSQSASFTSLSVDQRQNSAFSTRRMKSHLSYPCAGSWFYLWWSGSEERDIRENIPPPAPEPAATRSHPSLLSFRAGSFASFRFLGNTAFALAPLLLILFYPSLPAPCLPRGREFLQSLLAAALTQRKSKCLSGSLVCISLLCLQLGTEVLLQLESMPWNSIFQGWV